MREIKFRAWHKEQEKMYSAEEMGRDQLTLMPDGRGFANISGKDTGLSRIDDGRRMIPLQYTGLKDSKGQEIYEGDKIHTGGLDCVVVWNQNTCSFRLTRAGKQTRIPQDTPLDINHIPQLEVIGNIWETPALVKA